MKASGSINKTDASGFQNSADGNQSKTSNSSNYIGSSLSESSEAALPSAAGAGHSFQGSTSGSNVSSKNELNKAVSENNVTLSSTSQASNSQGSGGLASSDKPPGITSTNDVNDTSSRNNVSINNDSVANNELALSTPPSSESGNNSENPQASLIKFVSKVDAEGSQNSSTAARSVNSGNANSSQAENTSVETHVVSTEQRCNALESDINLYSSQVNDLKEQQIEFAQNGNQSISLLHESIGELKRDPSPDNINKAHIITELVERFAKASLNNFRSLTDASRHLENLIQERSSLGPYDRPSLFDISSRTEIPLAMPLSGSTGKNLESFPLSYPGLSKDLDSKTSHGNRAADGGASPSSHSETPKSSSDDCKYPEDTTPRTETNSTPLPNSVSNAEEVVNNFHDEYVKGGTGNYYIGIEVEHKSDSTDLMGFINYEQFVQFVDAISNLKFNLSS